MASYIIGIDVGGTNIKMGLVHFTGRIIDRTNLPTMSFVRSKIKLIEAMVSGVGALIQKNRLTRKDIQGIGIGLPGLVDARRGVVNVLVNIPHWKNVPLKRIIEQKIHVPTFLDNDVNLIALGEWKLGAGRGLKNLVCITLGTGIGGGLIIDSQLYRGEGFTAGEIGHIPLNENGPRCNCGGYGCLEQYIGNGQLLRKARKIFKNKNITLEGLNEMADQKDTRAIQFWRDVAVHLGNGLASVVNILNPRCFVIGGGVANAHRHLFQPLAETLKKRAMKIPAGMVRIKKARLGPDAGIIGAYILVKQSTRH